MKICLAVAYKSLSTFLEIMSQTSYLSVVLLTARFLNKYLFSQILNLGFFQMAKDLLCVSFNQHSETVDEHNICDKDCALSMGESLYLSYILSLM